MGREPIIQHNINLSSQGVALKSLFSAYLIVVAVGYLMALAQIQFTHGMADGKLGLSIDDIVYSYYGNRSESMLEAKLKGSMQSMVPDNERQQIIDWVRAGASEQAFHDSGVKAIMEKRCLICHHAESDLPVPDFAQFENIAQRAETDTGASVSTLARVSHIHLFGIAFIFFMVGIVFSLASGVPWLLKSAVIAMPYIFLLVDVSGWWLTRMSPNFAWLVIVAGAAMALSFAFMWTVSMYEMWVLPHLREDTRDALLDE
jgi:hypothetical protein